VEARRGFWRRIEPDVLRRISARPAIGRAVDSGLDSLQRALAGLAGGCLFYPSAGGDRELPLRVFRPWIRDFWFVDPTYDLERQYGPPGHVCDVAFENVEGRTLVAGEPYTLHVRHETYPDDQGDFAVHACRGRGFDAFHTLLRLRQKRVAVFFHRGDSPGEGGSSFRWLRNSRLLSVLGHLEPGGLIVSDGSLAMRAFRQRVAEGRDTDPATYRPFERHGHRLECVAYLGPRYGPTLAWQVTAVAPE
jgi:hypothetical protein